MAAVQLLLGEEIIRDMNLLEADSRGLSEPLAEILKGQSPEAAFRWLTDILSKQRPALRSPNSKLLAYTGHSDAIDWLESNVSSPVTTHWGEGAALLGTPWGRIKQWLGSEKRHKIMALDTLYAYRLPAPNMAPFAQIAAPVLEEAPSVQEFELTLNAVMASDANPRMRQTIEGIINRTSEILGPRQRGVSVEDLPKLFLNPESFQNSSEILNRHGMVLSGIRESINKIIKGGRS